MVFVLFDCARRTTTEKRLKKDMASGSQRSYGALGLTKPFWARHKEMGHGCLRERSVETYSMSVCHGVEKVSKGGGL